MAKRKPFKVLLRNWGIIIFICLFILLIVRALETDKSDIKKYSNTEEGFIKTEERIKTFNDSDIFKGSAVKYDGAKIIIGNVGVYIYRMSTHHSDQYGRCQKYFGEKYAYMTLGINNKNGRDVFTWHCWYNKVKIILNDGTIVYSFDISDMDGFYSIPDWIRDDFSCLKKVLPGEIGFKGLAFYPSFSWKNVREVYISTRKEWNRAFWIKLQ